MSTCGPRLGRSFGLRYRIAHTVDAFLAGVPDAGGFGEDQVDRLTHAWTVVAAVRGVAHVGDENSDGPIVRFRASIVVVFVDLNRAGGYGPGARCWCWRKLGW